MYRMAGTCTESDPSGAVLREYNNDLEGPQTKTLWRLEEDKEILQE